MISAYTASFARPDRRRRRITFRPLVVACRDKKPWVRARFRLCGWNVNDISSRIITYKCFFCKNLFTS